VQGRHRPDRHFRHRGRRHAARLRFPRSAGGAQHHRAIARGLAGGRQQQVPAPGHGRTGSHFANRPFLHRRLPARTPGASAARVRRALRDRCRRPRRRRRRTARQRLTPIPAIRPDMNPNPASLPVPGRAALLETLNDNAAWDVIVIGGGATGLVTAVDAASRGYRTLLLEAADFAKGTSSNATKQVHGGVRYLAQGNIALVREALHERGLLHRNAPHLVWPLGFVVPAYGLFDQPFYGIGLKMYDMLAGKLNLSPSRWLSRAETLAQAATVAPSVAGRGLRGGVLYYDGQFDDARLAMALMRTLFDLGGTAVNYVRASGLTRNEKGAIDGVIAQDVLGGGEVTLRARCVVNAAGVWVDSVRRMDDAQAQTMVAPSQGVHLVLPREFLPGDKAILIPKTDDGRVL